VFFASAHFCIWRDGKIVQLVWERNRAWYARSSGMYYSGIEHEGGSGLGSIPIFWKTPREAERLREDDLMLRQFARLVAYICTKHGI
jgi:N-acetyl-anhydromuramyl-L-alanine amidase AmpD